MSGGHFGHMRAMSPCRQPDSVLPIRTRSFAKKHGLLATRICCRAPLYDYDDILLKVRWASAHFLKALFNVADGQRLVDIDFISGFVGSAAEGFAIHFTRLIGIGVSIWMEKPGSFSRKPIINISRVYLIAFRRSLSNRYVYLYW